MCISGYVCLYMCLWKKYALLVTYPFIPTSHLCLPIWEPLSFIECAFLFPPLYLIIHSISVTLPPPLLLFQMLVLQNQLNTNSLIPSLFCKWLWSFVPVSLCSRSKFHALFSFPTWNSLRAGALLIQPVGALLCPEHCALYIMDFPRWVR